MPLVLKSHFIHDCDLPEEETKDFILHEPRAYLHEQIYHWIKNHTSVERNAESRNYFPSSKTINEERRRHLTNPKYKWIIHPFCKLVFWRDIVTSYLWMFLFVTESYITLFYTEKDFEEGELMLLILILLAANFIVLLDMVSRFFTGYTISKTREVILEPKAIVKKYLKSYFIVDFLPCFAYFLFFILNPMDERDFLLLYQLHRLRLFRLYTTMKNTHKLFQFCGIDGGPRVFAVLALFAGIMLHALSCISAEWDFIKKYYHVVERNWIDSYKTSLKIAGQNKSTHFRAYLTHFGMTLCHFSGLPGEFPLITPSGWFIYACVLMVAIFARAYLLAETLLYFEIISTCEVEYEDMFSQLQHYMHKQEYNTRLKKRINTYFQYRFNNQFFDEILIMNSFTEHLRMEVLLYSCQTLIRDVQVFKGLSKAALGTVLARLKQEIYVSKDEVLSPGTQTGNIYFILRGTCAVMSVRNRELMHLEDGDHFNSMGEIDLYTGERLMYSLFALEITEVYVLENEDIKYCVEHFPEFEYKMNSLLRSNSRKLNLAFALTEDDDKTQGILEALRRHKILHAGIKRSAFEI